MDRGANWPNYIGERLERCISKEIEILNYRRVAKLLESTHLPFNAYHGCQDLLFVKVIKASFCVLTIALQYNVLQRVLPGLQARIFAQIANTREGKHPRSLSESATTGVFFEYKESDLGQIR